MPLFIIHTRNSDFHARDEGSDHADAAAALASGVQGAVALAADEIGHGHRSAAVEVNVEEPDGTRLLSSVVTISVSPLLAAGEDDEL